MDVAQSERKAPLQLARKTPAFKLPWNTCVDYTGGIVDIQDPDPYSVIRIR